MPAGVLFCSRYQSASKADFTQPTTALATLLTAPAARAAPTFESRAVTPASTPDGRSKAGRLSQALQAARAAESVALLIPTEEPSCGLTKQDSRADAPGLPSSCSGSASSQALNPPHGDLAGNPAAAEAGPSSPACHAHRRAEPPGAHERTLHQLEQAWIVAVSFHWGMQHRKPDSTSSAPSGSPGSHSRCGAAGRSAAVAGSPLASAQTTSARAEDHQWPACRL